jgi:hypothetical protein
MTLANHHQYQGIKWYLDDSVPQQVAYIPAAPTSQQTPQGDPAISLLAADHLSMLQVSSEWQVSDEQQAELCREIAAQTDLALDAIQLTLAPITVEKVVLALKNNQGEFEKLAIATSSGYLPFSTVFSVSLSEEQKAGAIAAFNGRKDQLKVTYHAVLEREIFVEVTISGDISQDLKQLSKSLTITDCLAQIERAIAQKSLKVDVSASDEATETLHERTTQLAKKNAAELLLKMSLTPSKLFDLTHFQSLAHLSDSQPIAIERSADISTWFLQGNGMDYVQIF